ncbi:Hint domain-containing protein [Jhaorihella thermophila]
MLPARRARGVFAHRRQDLAGRHLHQLQLGANKCRGHARADAADLLRPPARVSARRTGARPVETLAVGDLVTTLDNGQQPIRWIGRRVVEGRGDFAPIRFRKGAIGNRRDLRVSPQHRMLVTGWRAELLFDEAEILVAARHLVNGDTIHPDPCGDIEYIHLMFDRHEVIFAEGVPTESFHPGDYVMAQDRALMAELTTLFPELKNRARMDDRAARGQGIRGRADRRLIHPPPARPLDLCAAAPHGRPATEQRDPWPATPPLFAPPMNG